MSHPGKTLFRLLDIRRDVHRIWISAMTDPHSELLPEQRDGESTLLLQRIIINFLCPRDITLRREKEITFREIIRWAYGGRMLIYSDTYISYRWDVVVK